MADWQRCSVEATVVTDQGAVRLGPGAVVDLDMRVGAGTLRDCVDAVWFSPVETTQPPITRRRRSLNAPEDAHVD